MDGSGAGDALAAGFCVASMAGAAPLEAGRRALEVAALAMGRAGAQP
ncbi:MAG: hypothetical protein ACREPA_11015 [Candidatus Dormibacteraceae bacterium]